MLVYDSRYTRDARLTISKPLTVMSFSEERPRPIRYNIVLLVNMRGQNLVTQLHKAMPANIETD